MGCDDDSLALIPAEMLNKLLEMTPEQIEQLPPLERAQAQAIIGMFRGQQQAALR